MAYTLTDSFDVRLVYIKSTSSSEEEGRAEGGGAGDSGQGGPRSVGSLPGKRSWDEKVGVQAEQKGWAGKPGRERQQREL